MSLAWWTSCLSGRWCCHTLGSFPPSFRLDHTPCFWIKVFCIPPVFLHLLIKSTRFTLSHSSVELFAPQAYQHSCDLENSEMSVKIQCHGRSLTNCSSLHQCSLFLALYLNLLSACFSIMVLLFCQPFIL